MNQELEEKQWFNKSKSLWEVIIPRNYGAWYIKLLANNSNACSILDKCRLYPFYFLSLPTAIQIYIHDKMYERLR